MKDLLNTFSNHGVEVLEIPGKEILQDQGCGRFLTKIPLLAWRGGLVVGGNTQCLRNYVEEANLIRGRPRLRNQIRHIFRFDKFLPSKKMQTSFVLIANNSEDVSEL